MGYSEVFRNHTPRYFRQWYDVIRRLMNPNVKIDKKLFVNFYNGVKEDQYYEYKRYMELISTGFELSVDDTNKIVEIYVPENVMYPKWKPKKTIDKMLKKTEQMFPGYKLHIDEVEKSTIIFRAYSLDDLYKIFELFDNTINTPHTLYFEVPKYDSSKFPGAPDIVLTGLKGTGGIKFGIIREQKKPGRVPVRWHFTTNGQLSIYNPYYS